MISLRILALSTICIFGIFINCSYSNDTQLTAEMGTEAIEQNIPRIRTKRGIWDFFQKFFTTGNLIIDQYVDTKNSFNEAYNLLNEGFSDPAPSKPTLPSSSTMKSTSGDDSSEVSSTTEKYAISRYEFGRILGRNYRGLQRLTRLELDDALNASRYNIEEYRAEAAKQFDNSLIGEKKKQLNAIKG